MSLCRLPRRSLPLVGAMLLALAATAGCRQGFFTVAYLFKGMDIEAECKELKGKKVAVVCRPLVSMQYRNAGVAKDLAREVGTLLKRHVPKIQLIDHNKVAEWMDENGYGEVEYVDVGRAVKAELVVGIDLEQFDMLAAQTIYQGKASVSLKVYNCANGSVVFAKHPPQSVYPPNHVISTTGKQESDFRREFIAVLSDQIARHFYNHDPHADIALDSRAFD